MAVRLKRWHALIGAGAVALAIPVLAQGPESILPEGFGAPQPPAPRQPAQPQPAATPTPTSPPPPSGSLSDQAAEAVPGAPGEGGLLNEAQGETIVEGGVDLPAAARHSLDRIGPLTPDLGGLGGGAFGYAAGLDKARIMAATRAPIASRWASILLRRALLTQSDTPAGIAGADWVAERSWLLLRMGEADNARLLIQGVDNDRYTRRLYAIAMQSLLASADPAGMCPLLPRARDFSNEPSWFMAQAICASFSADQNSATAILGQAERRGIARGIDYRLAEKTVGAGPASRRSVKIEWAGVDRLTTWRFGLATATNVAIPEELYATVGQQVRAWEARAPMLTSLQRLPGTVTATRLGVFSGTAARGFYDSWNSEPDAEGPAQDIGDLLRTAYAGEASEERIGAMHDFWSRDRADKAAAGPGGVDYAALPVIARAAATVKPENIAGEDTPWLIAAMLSSGYDRSAARWSEIAEGLSGDARQRSWAMLATGTPQPRVPLAASRIRDFVGADESKDGRVGHYLVASLAGLDRIPTTDRAGLLRDMGIDPAPRGKWARAIMAAASRGEKGTVALLVAVGLQTNDWNAVPARHLYFITAALRQVGLDPYARMIAAEAMARAG
ncbi:MAG: hypothetical protein J7485_06825 [Sphingobium sp.]|nr:hypothetical protein [Sphingobium sp.]